jgi:vacuolar-type H+-ATPase subunit H
MPSAMMTGPVILTIFPNYTPLVLTPISHQNLMSYPTYNTIRKKGLALDILNESVLVGGELVVEESLRAIFEAEKKARGKIEAAHKKAAMLLESVKGESEKLKDEAKASALGKEEKIIQNFRTKAEADVQELLKKNRRQIQTLERKAEANNRDAVKLIVDIVTR